MLVDVIQGGNDGKSHLQVLGKHEVWWEGVYHATQHIYALKKKKKIKIPPYEVCFLVAAGFLFLFF